jgi:hypothetical protein
LISLKKYKLVINDKTKKFHMPKVGHEYIPEIHMEDFITFEAKYNKIM